MALAECQNRRRRLGGCQNGKIGQNEKNGVLEDFS